MEFRKNWQNYLIEAWALGTFMVACCGFCILIEHPAFLIRQSVENPLYRRFLMGLAMGLTAVFIIYSAWGKKSGAQMNPAVTLANWQLNRISSGNAFFYIVFQFLGGYFGVLLFQLFLPTYMRHPSVNYVVTIPANIKNAIILAFCLEFLMSFLMLSMVLWVSQHATLSKFTGYFVGLFLVIYITFEAPYSGMSINPARTVATAVPSGNYTSLWLYFLAPISGMLCAAIQSKPTVR